MGDRGRKGRWSRSALALAVAPWLTGLAQGEEAQTVCAVVKIEIRQELSLERQAFDAEMKIANGLTTAAIENVSGEVQFKDEQGNPVIASSDPSNTTAAFFIRVDSMSGIADVAGAGRVEPASTGEIHWLIIPARGSAGLSPQGKLYFVGAKLKYRLAGKDEVVEVTPDTIVVKPMPALKLDYFLPRDVHADDPLTPEIEPVQPFSLGVRVQNAGYGFARKLKIDSAQPKIVENVQGLLIGFQLEGSTVNDAPVQPTLNIDFGDIPPQTSRNARWVMSTTLSGTFREFTADYTHSDELGGELTSLIESVRPHFLVQDVRVDVAGRDGIRDFLSEESGVFTVFESDNVESPVANVSAQATLVAQGTGLRHTLTLPAAQGLSYVKLADPYEGKKRLAGVTRLDGKPLPSENAWLSKEKGADKRWHYFFSVFDSNSTGSYIVEFADPSTAPQPPVLQFVPDRTAYTNKQTSFLVEATDPNGTTPAITADSLPAGATLVDQHNGIAVFAWTPQSAQAGKYPITFRASDGQLNATRTATLTVLDRVPAVPRLPTVSQPISGTEVTSLKPEFRLVAQGGEDDSTDRFQVEVYADVGLSQLVARVEQLTKGEGAYTPWTLPQPLEENRHYYWRARSGDATLFSEWVNGDFIVNAINENPSVPALAAPGDSVILSAVQPTLSTGNASDPDADALSYRFEVFTDAALTELVQTSDWLTGDAAGTTAWTPVQALTDGRQYYWRVRVQDEHGAETASAVRQFVLNAGTVAPSLPALTEPQAAARIGGSSGVDFQLAPPSEAYARDFHYVLEIDTSDSFGSAELRRYTPFADGERLFHLDELVENRRYVWRLKAQNGSLESAWAQGEFTYAGTNDAPTTPTLRQPGDGSWVDTLRPRLDVNLATDADGDAISYEFEIYQDTTLTQRVASAHQAERQWEAPELLDDTDYWWRARAVDNFGGASDWTAAARFTVRNYDTNVPPTISVSTPAEAAAPSNGRYTIRWDDRDSDSNATVSLYYTTDRNAPGALIVDGLKEDPDGESADSYVWDTSALAPGAYSVYAVIYDEHRTQTSYAPGAVVVPLSTGQGGFVLEPKRRLTTLELGKKTDAFRIKLDRAPSAPVSIRFNPSNPYEGSLSPSTLVFTPANWGTFQSITVTGLDVCQVAGTVNYTVVGNRAVSLDPAYMQADAPDVAVRNIHNGVGSSSNIEQLGLCNYRYVSKTQVPGLWMFMPWTDYAFAVELVNTGATGARVRGRAGSFLGLLDLRQKEVDFGYVGPGERATSQGVIVLRAPTALGERYAAQLLNTIRLNWTLETY